MINVAVASTIFLFCLIGFGATSWKLGKQAGAEDTLQYLLDEGIIEIDFEED